MMAHIQSPYLKTLKDPRNRFHGIDSARLGIDSWTPFTKVYKLGLRSTMSKNSESCEKNTELKIQQRPSKTLLKSLGLGQHVLGVGRGR
jgi:hypothetical protein